MQNVMSSFACLFVLGWRCVSRGTVGSKDKDLFALCSALCSSGLVVPIVAGFQHLKDHRQSACIFARLEQGLKREFVASVVKLKCLVKIAVVADICDTNFRQGRIVGETVSELHWHMFSDIIVVVLFIVILKVVVNIAAQLTWILPNQMQIQMHPNHNQDAWERDSFGAIQVIQTTFFHTPVVSLALMFVCSLFPMRGYCTTRRKQMKNIIIYSRPERIAVVWWSHWDSRSNSQTVFETVMGCEKAGSRLPWHEHDGGLRDLSETFAKMRKLSFVISKLFVLH